MLQQNEDDLSLPPALAEVVRVEFDYDDGDGVDFQPYAAFDSAEDTTHWLRLWTGNPEADGSAYRVFGQDGAGGYAAIWHARPGRPLAEQPLVFLGSEGESGLVAGNLSDFLWLLAAGLGPREAALYEDLGPEEAARHWNEDRKPRPNPALAELAARHATTERRPALEILTEARAEFPTFTEDLDELCR